MGSRMDALLSASCTCPCACAILARLTSSSRFWTSSSRRARSLFRPSLSLSASSDCWAACDSRVVAWLSKPICRRSAIFASSSNRLASVALPCAAELVGPARRGRRLAAPLADGLARLARVVLDQPQVADGLGDGLLGLGDVVGEVADELVEHLLGILGRVEHGVDVRPDELADTTEDRGLRHWRGSSFRAFVPLPSLAMDAFRARPAASPSAAPRVTATAATTPATEAAEATAGAVAPAAPATAAAAAAAGRRGRPASPRASRPSRAPRPPPPLRIPPMIPPRIAPATSAAVRAAATAGIPPREIHRGEGVGLARELVGALRLGHRRLRVRGAQRDRALEEALRLREARPRPAAGRRPGGPR